MKWGCAIGLLLVAGCRQDTASKSVAAVSAPNPDASVPVTNQAQSERGFLSVEDFERVTRAGQPHIDVCIQRERERGGRTNGRYIGFTVALDGTTTEIVAGSAAQPLLASCLTEEIRTWRFPPPDGGTVRVEYNASVH